MLVDTKPIKSLEKVEDEEIRIEGILEKQQKRKKS
jgi:hypothetical protein